MTTAAMRAFVPGFAAVLAGRAAPAQQSPVSRDSLQRLIDTRVRAGAEAKDRFFFRVVEARLEFERDAAGAVTGVTLVQNGRRMPGGKLP